MFKDDSLNLAYSISMTTRKPRPNERDGIDYFFVEEEEFKNKVQQTINIMNVCGNLVLVQDEGKILKFVCSGLIGSEEEFFENIKRELSEAISES